MTRLFTNATSPYARLVRIAAIEKGVEPLETTFVDPWGDDAALLDVNPAARVPVMLTETGAAISESLLVLTYLDRTYPDPPLTAPPVDAVLARAGLALGVIDAAVHTLVGRLILGGAIDATGFDDTVVGLRRRRTMIDGLSALDAAPPAWDGGAPDLAVIAAVVAADYVAFRFGTAVWRRRHDALDDLAARAGERPSFATTRPTS